MGSIKERLNKDGTVSYGVAIRKKDKEIYATFDDLETAKLFIKIKEKVIDEVDAFETPLKEVIRLKDAFKIKIDCAIEEKLASSSIRDLNIAYEKIKNIIGEDFYINYIDFEKLKEISENLINTKVVKGGNYKNPTNLVAPSFLTVRRYIACLSSVYGCLIKKGVDIKNPCIEFMPYFLNINKKSNLD